MHSIEIACAIITKLGPDLIKTEYRDGYTVELADAIELDEVFVKLSEGRGIYNLLDTKGRFSVFSKDAQKYLAKEGTMVIENRMLGIAVIIDSLPNRLLAMFFVSFYKPPYPFKVFSNEEAALNYIEFIRESLLEKTA